MSTTSEAPSEISLAEEIYDDLGGCTIGDTRGACLLLEEISISRGVNQIIENVDWRVERGERWGIVGPNGAGKVCIVCMNIFHHFQTFHIDFLYSIHSFYNLSRVRS